MRPLGLVATALLLVAGFGAQAAPTSRVGVTRFNVVDVPIEIDFINASDETVEMPAVWRIGRARTDETVATYRWTAAQRRVAPNDTRTWVWDQTDGCHGDCDTPAAGQPVEPGQYVLVVGRATRRLHIGQFFQVGFDHLSEDERFTVFVNRSDDIEQMTAEAEAADKTQMVTGIVRNARGYNAPWRFTMGPGSIILAEVSVEVCDADPNYVQDHKRQWLGDRWCPWSSYVAAVGR